MEAPQEIKIWIYSTKSESMVSLMKVYAASKKASAIYGKKGNEFFIISNKCFTTLNLCIRLDPNIRPFFLRVYNKDGYIVLKNYPTNSIKDNILAFNKLKGIDILRKDPDTKYSFWDYSKSIENLLKTLW